jgi:hypothetical protein
MSKQLRWINPDSMQTLMQQLKGRFFNQRLLSYFSLGLNFTFPELTSIVLHWPVELKGDGNVGKCLQVELWHAIRHDLCRRASNADWYKVRGDLHLDIDQAELDKCILTEAQVNIAPYKNRMAFDLRLPGTRPWEPLTSADLYYESRHISSFVLQRYQCPPKFTVRYDCLIDPEIQDSVVLSVSEYQDQLRSILDNFWRHCLILAERCDRHCVPGRNWERYKRTLMRETMEHVLFNQMGVIPETNICANCQTRWEGLQRCSVCKVTKYCSEICQHEHWSNHRTQCKNLKK